MCVCMSILVQYSTCLMIRDTNINFTIILFLKHGDYLIYLYIIFSKYHLILPPMLIDIKFDKLENNNK